MGGAITLRPAADADVEALATMHAALVAEEAAFGAPAATEPPRRRVRRALARADGYLVVVEQGGRRVGYGECVLVPRKPTEAAISFVYVEPTARGGGLGRMIVDHLLAHLRGRGVRVVHSHVRAGNDTSLAMLRACGFAPDATWVKRVL